MHEYRNMEHDCNLYALLIGFQPACTTAKINFVQGHYIAEFPWTAFSNTETGGGLHVLFFDECGI
jgi:hypothetical protein